MGIYQLGIEIVGILDIFQNNGGPLLFRGVGWDIWLMEIHFSIDLVWLRVSLSHDVPEQAIRFPSPSIDRSLELLVAPIISSCFISYAAIQIVLKKRSIPQRINYGQFGRLWYQWEVN